MIVHAVFVSQQGWSLTSFCWEANSTRKDQRGIMMYVGYQYWAEKTIME